ncbi:hypothetical protein CGC48_08020 [Capnocytophaga cynodegmi]|uniref:Uncharacterized protein n=1 Tax=Capnocytophaga cynodegmi TaxID=28189 RepID=A0A250EA04_9FLAO|nr:hypothetical protein CGC48_08020 [Capnocytophaga cynodegmi]
MCAKIGKRTIKKYDFFQKNSIRIVESLFTETKITSVLFLASRKEIEKVKSNPHYFSLFSKD